MKQTHEQFKKILRGLFYFLLISGETAIFTAVWVLYYNGNLANPFLGKGNCFFALVYFILFLIFLRSFDGLKLGTYRKSNLMIAQVLATLSTVFISYLQIILLSAKITINPLPILMALPADFLLIFLVVFIGDFVLKKAFPARKTLIIYDSYKPDTFIQKVTKRKDKFILDEVVNINVGMEELKNKIPQFESIILFDVNAIDRNKILKVCFENNIRTYTTTKVSDILVRGSEQLHIFDTPLLLYRNIGLTFEQRVAKRFMDIVLSSILLVLTSPIFLISAIAIKCYDGGPVFFRQDRRTLNGKVFSIHKFRSMIVDAEKDGISHPAEQDDKRITPVGKVLRATRMDELPQLIDIFKGDMSLVGPRPERVEHVEQYAQEVPEFLYREKIRGGLTGYAQLYGKYNTSPYDKLQLDLMYIQKYSLLLDIKLLLMTVKIMFIKESTEGFSEEASKKIGEKFKNN